MYERRRGGLCVVHGRSCAVELYPLMGAASGPACLFLLLLIAELDPALKLLGKIEEKFVAVSDMMECTDDGRDSNIFVSKSFDATSHFESATQDVLKM